MKNLLILGAGSAGTMVANGMVRRLPRGWQVTVVDPEADHLYQPGLLFLPFGAHDEAKMVRPRRRTLDSAVRWLPHAVSALDLDRRRVTLDNGTSQPWDLLVVATGAELRPEGTEGLSEAPWGDSVHEFYTLEGALAMRDGLARFRGGKLVVNVVEMPIKCPVAPLEFLFLADELFRHRGMRDEVELVLVTPLEGAFTKPVCSRVLAYLLEEKRIRVETDFNTGRVDGAARKIVSWDDREVPYDLLVSIPLHGGAAFLEPSGIGNEMGFVRTDRHTLFAGGRSDVMALGDATDLPASKAGSVAHFQSGVAIDNLRRAIAGRSPRPGFDGHTNCFIESGDGKALLIDFNYHLEPVPGKYPLPLVGPLSLLAESRLNHLGKLGFRWIYWNALLPAHPLPLPHHMTMAGKKVSAAA